MSVDEVLQASETAKVQQEIAKEEEQKKKAPKYSFNSKPFGLQCPLEAGFDQVLGTWKSQYASAEGITEHLKGKMISYGVEVSALDGIVETLGEIGYHMVRAKGHRIDTNTDSGPLCKWRVSITADDNLFKEEGENMLLESGHYNELVNAMDYVREQAKHSSYMGETSCTRSLVLKKNVPGEEAVFVPWLSVVKSKIIPGRVGIRADREFPQNTVIGWVSGKVVTLTMEEGAMFPTQKTSTVSSKQWTVSSARR